MEAAKSRYIWCERRGQYKPLRTCRSQSQLPEGDCFGCTEWWGEAPAGNITTIAPYPATPGKPPRPPRAGTRRKPDQATFIFGPGNS